MQERLGQLQEEILADLRQGGMRLPNIPHVISRIREALMEEGKSFEEIGRIVQLDQGLASRLIHVANSPLFRGVNKIDTPQAAISWLGLRTVRNLATSLALKNAFQGSDPRLRRMLGEAWLESCRVSAISHVLGRFTVGIKADKALLAGMVHNIGVLPFVNYLGSYPELLDEGERLRRVVVKWQGKLGSLLLRHWRFEPEFFEVPLAVNNPAYESGGKKPNYADIVLVAKMHSRFGRRGDKEALTALTSMPAFMKLPVRHLGAEGSLEILEQSQQEIASLMELLKG